jgi:hypothetical protein
LPRARSSCVGEASEEDGRVSRLPDARLERPGLADGAGERAVPRPRELAAATLIALLVAGALLWRVWLLGEVLVPADIVFQDPAWHSVAPAGFTGARNPLLSDQIRLFFVLHDLAARSIAGDGEVPWWNPYAFAGQPLVGNAQSALFFPPNLLLRWLPASTVANLRALLLVVAGGVLAYLYARRVGTSHLGGCITLLGFVLGGPFVVWLGFPLANVLVTLPLLLWAAEGIVAGRRALAWTVLAALGIGLAILGGHPETSFHVAALFAVYALARALGARERARPLRVVGLVAVAGLLGAAIGAVQLLPFLDALLASSTLSVRHEALAGASPFYSATWLTEAATAVTLLYPTFFGTPTSGNYAWPFAGLSNYNRQTLYFGALALALALAAVADPRRRRPVPLLAALAVGCLLIAWRFPLLEVVNHLPVLSVVRNDRLRLPFAFFGAVLAGFGFDALCGRDAASARPRRTLSAVLLVTISLPVAVLALAPLLRAGAPGWMRRLARHLADDVFVASLPQSWTPLAVALLAWLLLATPLGLRTLGRAGRDLASVALVGLELLVLAWGYNPSVPRDWIFPATRTTRLLGEQPVPARLIATGAFWPNYGTPYGIAQIEAYDLPVPRAFVDLYRTQGGRDEDHHQRWRPDWPLLDLLGVDYVVSPVPLKQRGLVPVLRDGAVTVYRNEGALPRAWLVHDHAVARDERDRLRRLAGGRLDFARSVLLDRPPPPEVASALREPPPGAIERVEIRSYRPNHVVVDVVAEAPGLLVTSEADASGWTARVDGEPAPILRANHAFRSVPVPQGRHRVTFDYAPAAARIGSVASLGGLLVAALALAREARRGLRRRPAPRP